MTYQLIIDDFIGPWAYSKNFVRDVLAKHTGRHVDVKISSYGGSLDHGLDIRQQFLDHGDVTVYFSGFVASAATVAALGAKRIVMSKYAHLLVHKCSNFISAWGNYNADQMQELIERLTANKRENDKIDVVLATMYADRCGKNVADILDTLKRGEWLTADEALEMGFIDEIGEPEGEKTAKVNITPELEAKFNAFGLPSPPSAKPVDDGHSAAWFRRLVNAVSRSIAEAPADDHAKTANPSSNPDMHNYDFNAAVSTLKLDAAPVPDARGMVLLSAGQLETLSRRIGSRESSVTEKEDIIKKRDNKISELSAQVDALRE
ncbi:MAG: Clp protease ClpP, partial [Muribaculaceae bacterium]|nr:Clp protease ClpP [Muribaculaceae bacterium]